VDPTARRQARFWVEFFAASINEKYLSQTNPGFASYFVTIDDEVVIELMTKPGLQQASADNNHTGWAHLALSVGGRNRSMPSPNAPGRREYWFRRRAPPATAIMRR
jgi:lactoylglutathione lyase